MSETYIPTARDATIAYFGRNAAGNLRLHCCACLDEHPLTDAARVYGDLWVQDMPRDWYRHPQALDRIQEHELCDVCGAGMIALARSCQLEHDEQQERWARASRVEYLLENGIAGAVRCRVY